jgi:3-dehydroquinate synthase
MAMVHLKLPHHQYTIWIEPGLLGELGSRVRTVAPHGAAAVFVDENIASTHGAVALKSMHQAGYKVTAASVQAGENHKNLDTVRELYDVMLNARLERKSPVLALGGGVIGDTIGFVASTYLRGVPFVQCPTTLLGMVDSSVGGKVGVNVPQGKNLIGSFYQPNLVLIDTNTLSTLPARELRCGLAECVKHGVIRDPALFDWIEDNLDAILSLESDALVELVRWNVQIKANVVMADEKETGERAHLNFGHTFGHAIEATQGYDAEDGYHHGEAISLGMVAAARLAAEVGRCGRDVPRRLVRLLARIGLPTHSDRLVSTDKLIDTMRLDKKVADGLIRLVLPDQLGAVSVVDDTDIDAIAHAWNSLREPAND